MVESSSTSLQDNDMLRHTERPLVQFDTECFTLKQSRECGAVCDLCETSTGKVLSVVSNSIQDSHTLSFRGSPSRVGL